LIKATAVTAAIARRMAAAIPLEGIADAICPRCSAEIMA
jgi:hypothetical protein